MSLFIRNTFISNQETPINHLVLWLSKYLNTRQPVQIPVKVKPGKSNQGDLFRQLPDAVRWRFFDLTDEGIKRVCKQISMTEAGIFACQTWVSTLSLPARRYNFQA
jgi:hypothetical protein